MFLGRKPNSGSQNPYVPWETVKHPVCPAPCPSPSWLRKAGACERQIPGGTTLLRQCSSSYGCCILLYIHCLLLETLAEEMDQQMGLSGSPECVQDHTLESMCDLTWSHFVLWNCFRHFASFFPLCKSCVHTLHLGWHNLMYEANPAHAIYISELKI